MQPPVILFPHQPFSPSEIDSDFAGEYEAARGIGFPPHSGKLFNRGVVFREFMPIVEQGGDVMGLPVIEETRLFFWNGSILVPPLDTPPSPLDERKRWETLARRFQSPFITIDVARLTDGTWKVVEVGDGGVSGLPMGLDPERFYAALWNQSIQDPAG